MAEPQVGRRFRVGLVVLVALVAAMAGIFMVGQRANLWKKKLPYVTRFESASGLVAGNNVRLSGVNVGNVIEVVLTADPADRTVRVVYDVDRRAAPRLRKGTRASIKTIGLLGDKYIELEGGKVDEPEVPVEGEIPAAPGGGIDKLLEGGGDLLPDLSAIASSLKNILGRTEKGEGFLGAITTNSEESKRLGSNLNESLRSLNSMLKKIETGNGLAGKLFFDDKYGKETSGGALRSDPVGPVRVCQAGRRHEIELRVAPRPDLRPGGKEEGLPPRGQSVGGRRLAGEGHPQPRDRKGCAPDPPARRGVRQGVHAKPEDLLGAARIDRAQARRGAGNGGQVDQRPGALRRRQPARGRRGPVGAAALAHQGPTEGRDQDGVRRGEEDGRRLGHADAGAGPPKSAS